MPQAGDRIDIPAQPGRKLRGVHRQRRPGAGRVVEVHVPVRAEHLLGGADRDRRDHPQMEHVDRRLGVVLLERPGDGVASRRRRAVLALQARDRQILSVARRGRVARRLDRACDPRLVGDHPDLQRQLRAGRRLPQVLQALVRDVAVVDARRGGRAAGDAQHEADRERRGEVTGESTHVGTPSRGVVTASPQWMTFPALTGGQQEDRPHRQMENPRLAGFCRWARLGSNHFALACEAVLHRRPKPEQKSWKSRHKSHHLAAHENLLICGQSGWVKRREPTRGVKQKSPRSPTTRPVKAPAKAHPGLVTRSPA